MSTISDATLDRARAPFVRLMYQNTRIPQQAGGCDSLCVVNRTSRGSTLGHLPDMEAGRRRSRISILASMLGIPSPLGLEMKRRPRCDGVCRGCGFGTAISTARDMEAVYQAVKVAGKRHASGAEEAAPGCRSHKLQGSGQPKSAPCS